MDVSLKSFIATILQFLSMLLLFLTGPWVAKSIFLIILEILALGLWLWAFGLMLFKKNYGLFPEVSRKRVLITKGPFRFIRHPIYSGMLLLALALVLNYLNLGRLFLFLLLLVSSLLKLTYEEEILKKHFKGYINYQKRTKKLIPFLY